MSYGNPYDARTAGGTPIATGAQVYDPVSGGSFLTGQVASWGSRQPSSNQPTQPQGGGPNAQPQGTFDMYGNAAYAPGRAKGPWRGLRNWPWWVIPVAVGLVVVASVVTIYSFMRRRRRSED